MVSEKEFLLHSLYMGIFINFLYDILRIFRRSVPHNALWVSVEDFGFWVYCGAEVFLLMYRESNGTFRWFAVFGAMAGMFLYRKLVSPFFVKYMSMLLCRILGCMTKALRWLSRPFRRGCTRAGRAVVRGMKKWRHRIKFRLTFFLKRLKINLKK